jgi:hypothetical protein
VVSGEASAKFSAKKIDCLDDQSSKITSTVYWFCLEFKMKLCWASRLCE